MGTWIDISGRQFGQWTVLAYTASRTWLCRCACGTECQVDGWQLRSGRTRSCGCLTAKKTAARMMGNHYGQANRKHGATVGRRQTPEYKVWSGMIKRCTNPNAFYYHRYGGRGIFVCERWNSFENFLADMGQRPSPRHSINRKDNDGPYSPENCCWSIQRDQMNNMARNHPITAFGETLNVFQWAERTGLCESTIRRRIKDGWEPEQALSEAPRDQRHQRNNRSITAFGETLLLIDWSRRSGIQSATILSRIKSGWDPERAVTEPAGTSRRGPKPK